MMTTPGGVRAKKKTTAMPTKFRTAKVRWS